MWRGPARASAPPRPWPCLCAPLVSSVLSEDLLVGERMGCLQSGGPGCGSVDVFDVLNRVLAAALTGEGDVCEELAPIQGSGLFPALPGMRRPWAAGSFPNPCPLSALALHCPSLRLWSLPGCLAHLGGRCGPALLHSSGQRLGISAGRRRDGDPEPPRDCVL